MSSSPRDSRQPPRKRARPDTPSADEAVGAQSDPSRKAERTRLERMLKRAAEGDQEAWRILVETYSHRVFGLIRAQCGSADLAEEITQSAFCTVVAKIDTYSELGRFEQWLFRIAMNRLRDEMRRRKRQARPTEDQMLRTLAETGAASAGVAREADSPFDESDAEQLAALREAMAQLSESDREIIHLRHCAGLSFKDIAELLDQPLGTTLARQHRALKKLADLMQPATQEQQEPDEARSPRRSEAPAERPPSASRRHDRKGGEPEGLASSGP